MGRLRSVPWFSKLRFPSWCRRGLLRLPVAAWPVVSLASSSGVLAPRRPCRAPSSYRCWRLVRRPVSSCRRASRHPHRLVGRPVRREACYRLPLFARAVFSSSISPVGFFICDYPGWRMAFSYETQGMSRGRVWDAKEETAGAGVKMIA